MRFVEQSPAIAMHQRTPSRTVRRGSPDELEARGFASLLQSSDSGPIQVGSGNLTSLVVSFERKAAVIRLSDAAVQEISLSDDLPQSSVSAHRHHPHKRESSDGFSHSVINAGAAWLPIISVHLPDTQTPTGLNQSEIEHQRFNHLKTVCVLTKGLKSHIIRSPIPNPISTTSPLVEIRWTKPPTGISARISQPAAVPSSRALGGSAPVPSSISEALLQIVGFGQAGIEVIEISVASLKAHDVRLRRGASFTTTRSDSLDLAGGISLSVSTSIIPFSVSSSSPLNLDPPSIPNAPRSRHTSLSDSHPNTSGIAVANPQPRTHHSPIKGKGKEKSLPPVPPRSGSSTLDTFSSDGVLDITRGYLDIGADASLLCRGGLWHDVTDTGQRVSSSHQLDRNRSFAGTESSFDGFSDGGERTRQEERQREVERERDGCGVYGCAVRMAGDYRVFYVGDYVEGDADEDTETL